MTNLVTVIGLERYCVIRNANGAQCDVCGKTVNFDRKDARQELDALHAAGWVVPFGSTRDFSTPVYCPDHADTDTARE